jgi:hypothetical protein
MGKRVIFICGLLVLLGTSLWPAGRKEANESHPVEEPEGFSRPIRIEEKKPGKYNYYLEAKDKAGNTTLAGPDNIYIDPPSDLPRTTAINPLPNMRVQGNLNVVGVAMDDDGVVGVELTVTRGKDGKGEELVRAYAEGTDYWYYFLKTTDPEIWTDGVYTVTSWATDVNGLSGISEDFPAKVRRQHSVYWNLDRKKPDTIVTSHEIGALVSGKIKVRGTVYDGNMVEYLRYSTDGGNKYIPVPIKYDKTNNIYNWTIDIDTKKLEDGPALVMFQAKDKMGSVGNGAHLFFVNNTPPAVEIVYPQPNTVVNGLFSIAGFAQHEIGLQSLSWKMGKTGGDFDLLPGNAWWSTDIDIRNLKTTSIEIEIRAVDVSGNTTVKKQKYKVDQNADLPVITLTEPVAGSAAQDGRLVVKGFVSDDDGAASVIYAVGALASAEIPCSGGYFQFVINDLPAGVHTVDFWAKDVTGVTGPKVSIKNISIPGALPQPRIESVTTGTGSAARVQAFYTGMTLRLDPRARTVMEIAVQAQALTSAAAAFGDQPAIPFRPSAGKDGLLRATVQVPANLSPGFTTIALTATDRFGRDVTFNEYVFIDETDPNPWFEWIRPNEAGGRIVLGNNEEVLIGLGNEMLASARLRGAGSENLFVDVDEYGRAILQARTSGAFGPFTLGVTTVNGAAFESRQFSITADFSAPRIALREAPQWAQQSVPLTFNLTGSSRITSVEYSLDMGESWQRLLTNAEIAATTAPVNADFTKTLDISALEDGAVTILIKAVNAVARETVVDFTVLKDTVPPEAELIMPIVDANVNGTIRMGFAIKEAGALRTITYRQNTRSIAVFNADDWDNDYACMFTEVLMDSTRMPLFDTMRFVFTDRAGNSSEINNWPFIIDYAMDIPVVQVTLPEENEVITTDFIVSGVMYDDDAIKQVYWKLDDRPEQVIVAENGFSIPISLSWLTDNEHTVTVTAEDVYGIRSDPVIRGFRVSLSEPEAAITYPRFDTVLRDAIEITGTSSDANGIKELQISVDNGNTFIPVFGTTSWNYRFNTRILKDGPHVIFYRVWDKYEIPAVYAAMVNVDNTPPEIILDSPADSAISTGKVSVMGRVIDPNLSAITLEFRNLTGSSVSQELRSNEIEIDFFLKQELDLAGQADGLYNLVIVAVDEAGNASRLSRNVELARESNKNFVEVYYPLDNENVQGVFNLYGFAGGRDAPGTVTVRINNVDREINDVDDTGFFRFSLDSETLINGPNKIEVHSNFGGTLPVISRAYMVNYKPEGPWVTIDSFNFGNFAFDRPYLTGRVGYALSEEEIELLAAKDTDKEVKAEIRPKAPDFMELSFDNGKTFTRASKTLEKGIDYRYRLETGEMPEGMHYIVAKSTMKNGDIAVTRMIVQVDKTFPVIRLISPEVGKHYNQEISYSASATDDVELEGVTYHLRKGDKALYGVPGFLQGLYFEGIIPPFLKQIWNNLPNMFAGGATYTDFGMGLSFFDDNVKIQVQYGFITQDLYDALGGSGLVRYGGSVLGVKVLASIYALPFGPLIGPDWEWLSASFALGANFSLFNIANEENPNYSPNSKGEKVYYTQSGAATWMGALLLQVEFPKVTIPKRKNFRTFSMFTEGQLWFVPTDVDAAAYDIPVVIPHIIMGLRLYIF